MTTCYPLMARLVRGRTMDAGTRLHLAATTRDMREAEGASPPATRLRSWAAVYRARRAWRAWVASTVARRLARRAAAVRRQRVVVASWRPRRVGPHYDEVPILRF
jgi:hypothetical protein